MELLANNNNRNYYKYYNNINKNINSLTLVNLYTYIVIYQLT